MEDRYYRRLQTKGLHCWLCYARLLQEPKELTHVIRSEMMEKLWEQVTLDLSEGIFHEMDTDGDGDVSFAELLKLMFKFARPDEIELMLTWVAPEPEPEPEPKAELSAEAKQMINSIFKLYDKDKSGTLSVLEIQNAFVRDQSAVAFV